MDPGSLNLIEMYEARLLKRIVILAQKMAQSRQTDPDGPLLDVTKEDYEAAAERFADHTAALVMIAPELVRSMHSPKPMEPEQPVE